MKQKLFFTLLAAAILIAVIVALAERDKGQNLPEERVDLAPYIQESRAMIKALAGNLKGELVSAVEEGGAENAVTVCNEKAPSVTAEVPHSVDVGIGRTSLKLRNPDNAPNAWEQDILKKFEQGKADGIDPKTLEHGEIVDGEFRYMKAIPTAGVCMTCHGSDVDEDLYNQIKMLYPDDAAIGYEEGSIRGAFTVTLPLKD